MPITNTPRKPTQPVKAPVVTICLTQHQLAINPHVLRATIELLTALGMYKELG